MASNREAPERTPLAPGPWASARSASTARGRQKRDDEEPFTRGSKGWIELRSGRRPSTSAVSDAGAAIVSGEDDLARGIISLNSVLLVIN